MTEDELEAEYQDYLDDLAAEDCERERQSMLRAEQAYGW